MLYDRGCTCMHSHQSCTEFMSFTFICYLTVWGVEPDVTAQTSWLESTGVHGVRQNEAGGNFARKRASVPVVGSLGQTTH